jgi:lactoylglutathione lyase
MRPLEAVLNTTGTAERPWIGFDHVGIVVSDLERYTRWYTNALDLTVELEWGWEQIDLCGVVLIHSDGWRLELTQRKGAQPSPRASNHADQHLLLGVSHLCLQVHDIQRVFDKLVAAGATVLMEPQVAVDPDNMISYMHDPEGNLIELLQRPRATST